MAYQTIRPAAYVPDPGTGPFQAGYHALAFPRAWREVILELYRHGKRNPEKIKSVPIHRLNSVIRAVAPDLVSVASRAAADDAGPWLYTAAPYPASVLSMLVNAWLRELQPGAEAFPLVREAAAKLDTKSLAWRLETVDLLENTVTGGGTADPASRLYRLLPEIIAARIEQLPPYEHNGEKVAFRRVATSQGAELMSWPPLEHKTLDKDRKTRLWNYSGLIQITLQTVPFSQIPRIHLHTGIRRWVRGRVWLPADRGVTVYLLADGPWLTGTPEAARFAAAQLSWDRTLQQVAWAHGGPAGMLAQLSVREFPVPDVLAKQPEAWLGGSGGVTAAVVHHTMMDRHGVGTGLMPSERQRLTEWAAQALTPEFRPIGDMRRSAIAPRTPPKTLRSRVPTPTKDPAPGKVAEAAVRNTEIALRNAVERRSRVGAVVGDSGLSAHLLYQTDQMRGQLIRAAADSLGLAGSEVTAGPDTWIWQTSELTVRIYARPLGSLGAPLDAQTPPRKGQEQDAAIAVRRAAVRDFLGGPEHPSQIVFVELEGRQAFHGGPATDPKYAIRIGCADAGRVSQFFQPHGGEADEPGQEGNDAHRADAAWADGMRQIGMRIVPQHSLGDAIPEKLNQLAFWMVKRRSDGPTGRQQFTPIAVLIRPDQSCIMGRSPATQGWVPYPDLLKGLTGQVRADQLRSRVQQQAEAAAFIQTTLYALRGAPTLAATDAHNSRDHWPWQTNRALIMDKIQIGGAPVQRLALHGKQLRLARLRERDRDETPQWWAPKDEEHAGIAKGLWIPADASAGNRVFGSTIEKAGTHTLSVDATKLTTHVNGRGRQEINSGKNAWNPDLLEVAMIGLQEGDDPEAWAMFLHQQRSPDDYRNGLALPLVMHLAKLASEYALPHEGPGQARLNNENGDVSEPSEAEGIGAGTPDQVSLA